MIIAISSAPPIDTTVLANALADEHGLEVRDDPAGRVCKAFGFQTIYDMPHALQAEVREQLIADHVALVQSAPDLVLTYSIVNYLADWMRWFWPHTSTEKWERLLASASDVVSSYDHIHHVEVGAVRPYDGYVWFDKRNAVQIDRLIRTLYDELEVLDRVQFDTPRYRDEGV